MQLRVLIRVCAICILTLSGMLLCKISAGTTVDIRNGRKQLPLTFVGEIRQKSYIRLVMAPLNTPASGNERVSYKGTCYESITGTTFPVAGFQNPGTRKWSLRCLNPRDPNKIIATFTGKETDEGDISGVYVLNGKSFKFYLRKQ
jgi:hypothetical protein